MNAARPDEWRRHRAARVLAHYATDAAELAEFLDMAGLTPQEGRFEPVDDPSEERIESTAEPEPAVPPDEVRRLASALLASYTDAVRNS